MYLLDSNIYINFYDRYYRMAFFPSFWDKLPSILKDSVVIPDIVVAENYQDAIFKKWLDDNYDKSLVRHQDYVQEWAEVIQYISDCGFYKPSALTSDKGWAKQNIADPWLIAIAKKEGYTIVTAENKNPNLNPDNPSKSAKIPDVCDQLQVPCITMNDFFKIIHLNI